MIPLTIRKVRSEEGPAILNPPPLSMNRQPNECEVIILGSGLGGLIAAALLVKKGHQVLLLKEKGYQSSYRREGYEFTPFSNFSEKRLGPALLRRISKELDLSFPEGSLEQGLPGEGDLRKTIDRVPFQVILPRARIDLFDDPSLLQMEWKREFPDELTPIGALYHEFGRVLDLLESREKKEGSPFFPIADRSLIQKWFSFFSPSMEGNREVLSSLSREFNELIKLRLMVWGSLYPDAFPVSLMAYLLLQAEYGGRVSQMDLEGLEKRVFDSFLQSGGEVEEIGKVERVDKRWRRGFALTLEGDRRVFHGRSLILNAPLHSFGDLFGKEEKSLSRWLEKIRPRYLLFPCLLGIRDKAVPVGMRDLLVSMLDVGKPYEEGNVLFLGLSPGGEGRGAPEGRRALTVQSLVPYSTFRSWNQVSFASHRESVMKHVNHLIPFLEQFLEFADFDWTSEQVRRWSYPYYLYETPDRFDWREGLVPNRVSKNLYLIGKENFPHLGLEGEVLSGLRVAEQVSGKVGV